MQRSTCFLALLFLVHCASSQPVATEASSTQRLESTPRHNEWVAIPRDGRTLHAYVTYPERSTPAPAVLLIHENRGLTDWERSVADRLAENGFLVIAPDMLSGMAPGGGKASDFSSLDAAREAISKLSATQVMADLDAAADYVLALSSSSGTLSVGGFCWGGARTWDFANRRSDLAGAFVFYGTGPQNVEQISGIRAPVYGFYGENDARVNATIARTEELMAMNGKVFDRVIYKGAGHAFMRTGESAEATEPNRMAHDEAWKRWLALLRDAK